MLVHYREPKIGEFLDWHLLEPKKRLQLEKVFIEYLEEFYPEISDYDPVAIEVKLVVNLLKGIEDGAPEEHSPSFSSPSDSDQAS